MKREMNVKNAWGTYKEYTFKQRSHPAKVHSKQRIHMNNIRKRRKAYKRTKIGGAEPHILQYRSGFFLLSFPSLPFSRCYWF